MGCQCFGLKFFRCAIAGIANEHTDRNTTAYIQNWISKLEEDIRCAEDRRMNV
jgi:hypothetical protein